MEESKDLKNRLKVFSNLGNVSYNHETTAILKGEIHGLREYNKSKRGYTKTSDQPHSPPLTLTTPTHSKYTSTYPHPPRLTHKKCSPIPTHPKYTSTYPHPPPLTHKKCSQKIYLHPPPPTPTHP